MRSEWDFGGVSRRKAKVFLPDGVEIRKRLEMRKECRI